tara:strand:- start:6601 stop:7431 length:831 start_codon:yes stop_codon:yes gene_type:complete
MDVYRHVCEKPNIGDEINAWFWQETLGEDLSQFQPEALLVGIGTVLNNKLPTASHYHILGSGYGYAEQNFKLKENSTVHFVRGPLTAKALSVSENKAITDPAILISKLRPQAVDKKFDYSFMPHITMDNPKYKSIIEKAGINYISPSDPENQILEMIASSKILLTSAMHGAIFADSYRVPWIPFKTSHQILDFKWNDWGASMDIDINFVNLPPIWNNQETSFIKKIVSYSKEKLIIKNIRKALNSVEPILSKESVHIEKKNNVLEAIASFKRAYLA